MDKRGNRLSPMVRNIITSGMAEKHNVETMRKVMLLNVISITGVIFLVPLGIVAYVQGNSPLGFIDHFAALLLILNLLYLRRSENYQFACSFGITIAAILFFYLLVTGGVNNTAHVWYYTFPLFSSFLLGSKKGAVATIILFILAIIFFAVDLDSPYLTNYSNDFIIRFIPSFAVVFIYSYASEYFREKAEEKLTFKNDRLESANKEKQKLINELQETKNEVTVLQGILPICANCKKIRDDGGYWEQVEKYIQDRSEAQFSHGICPECAKKLYPEFYKGE